MNINTVVYSAKLVDGKLDEAEPIHVYWINFAKDIRYKDIFFFLSSGKDQEELNFVEKKSAYGITYIFCCFYLKLALKKEKNQDMLLVI